jgi:hypothetical protein
MPDFMVNTFVMRANMPDNKIVKGDFIMKRHSLMLVCILSCMTSTISIAVDLDLSDTTCEVSGENAIRLDNVVVSGQTYWGTFAWNNNLNIFELSTYGVGATPPGSTIQFSEDFSQGLSNWYSVVYDSEDGSRWDEPPYISNAGTTYVPSLDPNGDSWCGNGAYTKRVFDFSSPVTLEFDAYISSGRWNWLDVGFSNHMPNLTDNRGDGVFVDSLRCDLVNSGETGVFINGYYPGCDGDTRLLFQIESDSGVVPHKVLCGDWADGLLDGWHHFKITIRSDRYVEFYVDNALKYTSDVKAKTPTGTLPIVAGGRSYDAPVLIDNIQVKSNTQ